MDKDFAPVLILLLFLSTAYLFEPGRFKKRFLNALLTFALLCVAFGLIFVITTLPFYNAMGVVILFNIILFSAN